MKKWTLRIMAACLAGFIVPAAAQTSTNEMPDDNGNPPMEQSDQPPPDMPAEQSDQQVPVQMEVAPAQGEVSPAIHLVAPKAAAPMASSQTQATAPSAPVIQTPSAFTPPTTATGDNPDELRLNFNDVPLDMVLNYLSDAAGFIIVMDTQVHGTVSVISSHPMTRDEAVDLLNSVLNQNGYAAIRNGRTLTIMDKSAAKSGDIPVQVGNDPGMIPKNDVIVTQIIPVRYVDATQLVSDLSSFVSPEATIVANQAGNSIVVTDTQENIRHLMEIISAIDSSAAGETEIQVFHLAFANPNDVATELGEMFPSGNTSGSSQLPIRFGGGGFGGGGFFRAMMANAAGGGSGSDSNNRAQKQSQVTAVADGRTQSIIVMASKDLMPEIAGMMTELDVPSNRDQHVYAYHLSNADPQEVAQILQNTFPSTTSGRSSSSSSSSQQSESSALIQRENQNATTVGQTSSSISTGTGTGTARGVGGGGSAP
jgi:hypothetical protein